MGRPKKSKIKPFDIPNEILDKLNEMCAGGFMLFTIDDQGNFRPYSTFDDELVFNFLKTNTMNYLEAINNIEKQQMLMSLIPQK